MRGGGIRKKIETGGRQEGGGREGEQVVQSVESYISSLRLLEENTFSTSLSGPFSEGNELCIILRIFPQNPRLHSDFRCRPDQVWHPAAAMLIMFHDLGSYMFAECNS